MHEGDEMYTEFLLPSLRARDQFGRHPGIDGRNILK
jgi:hypothetical protein